jgi:2-polyprenyl-6-methoxyphenol hydroxylase-like FAD-dependent oxidoreductase
LKRKARALVRMSDGEEATFDRVVVAEGVHSTSRALFWPDAEYRPLGVVYVAGVIDAVVEPRVVEVFTGLGAQLGFVPIDARRTFVYAYLRGELGGTDPHTAVPGLLRTTFRDHDAATLAGLEALGRSDALFVDAVGLVHVPTLARGRAVLLGDAGYCPTFLSGVGASLGVIGAAALGRCLREAPMADALARYDQLVRPMSAHFQRNARGHVGSLLTSSPLRRWAIDAAMHQLPPALLEWSFGHQFGSEAASVRAILGS